MSNALAATPVASPRELIVVAYPGAELRITDQAVTSLAGADVSALNELLAPPERKLKHLFGLSEERLKLKTGSYAAAALPDLSVFYRLYAPDDELEALAARVLAEPVIEAAFIKPGAEPPIWLRGIKPNLLEFSPFTRDFSAFQGYLNPAAKGGIDARFAWTLDGGRGRGVRIIDVEGAWRFSHEDLMQNQGGVVGGAQVNDFLWRNHGTAVLGIYGGDDNAVGVKGICPDAIVSAVSKFGPEQGWGSAAAIRLAADMLSPGDIIVIELQQPGPSVGFARQANTRGYIPIEWWPDDMAAIRYATGKEIIVIEAGGNGRQDLDDPIYDINPPFPHGPFPADWRNPFRRNPVDPGTIIVGAGAPPASQGFTTRPDRCRLPFSNFGSAFDAQGWGELVTTCGFGNLEGGGGPDEDFWYTDSFSGTSSAAPMVAGALGCVQGILKARGLPPLNPASARALLRSTGSPQQDHPSSPASRRIGNRPNLREMIDALT